MPTNPNIPAFRLCGNIYFVGEYRASSHLIDTGEGLILIDTGYEGTADIIMSNIKELGFDIKDVKIILFPTVTVTIRSAHASFLSIAPRKPILQKRM